MLQTTLYTFEVTGIAAVDDTILHAFLGMQ